MALVSDYTFNKTTRIGDDQCDKSQQNIQNSQAATYMLDNFRPACPMSKAVDFATSQLDVNYSGSHQVGINGCNIDENSELSMSDLSKPKCRISLQERPFLTVPYLGKGKSNPVLESQLQQGDFGSSRKSVNPSSEVCYMGYSQTPMIPSLQATINNPSNLIEGAAAEGWIRGGLPSRELTHDKDYNTKHTPNQYN